MKDCIRNAAILPGLEASRPGRYELLAPGGRDGLRGDLEQFVREAFRREHGAEVRSFMPDLLGLRSPGGRLCSVVGYRLAGSGPLYLERYLDEPVEAALARRGAGPVPRSRIAEVGNLAGTSCRGARHLVSLLPGILLDRGQQFVVFTATRLVRELLQGLGAPLIDLGAAEPGRVAGLPDQWGRYYATEPRVMAGYLPEGLGLGRRRR